MTISVFSRTPILLIFMMSLVSCLPALHIAYLRPAVSGIVLENEKPIPGVELYLSKFPSDNQPCTRMGEIVRVSADGSFSWASIQERKLTDSLINPVADSATLTVLCIRHPTKGALIGAMLFMMQNKSSSLHLMCDTGHPHSSGVGPDTTSTMLGQAQYCETSRPD
jgi:hypothetical protein